MNTKKAKKPIAPVPLKLRTLDEVIEELRSTFGHIEGECIAGFRVKVRCDNANLEIEWGNANKMKMPW